MKNHMSKLTALSEWLALTSHQQAISPEQMRDWFAIDQTRFPRLSIKTSGILLDYSRHRVTDQTISLLCDLAKAVDLNNKINKLFNGELVNITEKRPALHTALRDPHLTPLYVNGADIAPLISAALANMQQFTANVHSGAFKGATGKAITRIVNVGIGGSYSGPLMTTHALKEFAISPLQFDFVACVDPIELHELLATIDPETCLFIISSKSFTTLETLTNARTIAAWMSDKLGTDALKQHFVAVTADSAKAEAFGIPSHHIFPMWEWVGGRYSIWSAIGLPLMLMIGAENFAAFLQGAHEMDQHFREADFAHNMPVMMALLGLWYTNFFGAEAQVIAPYTKRLTHLITYLQQADMESNGKRVTLTNDLIDYTGSPVIFGEAGCNAQHTYHQLLHQGSKLIPIDFILIEGSKQAILNASALSQAQALMRGKTVEEALDELLAANLTRDEAKPLALHRSVPGNRPSSILLLDQLTPKSLGALIALYEHKIFVQGVIWDINSFDQFGVELGKQLLPDILKQMENTSLLELLNSLNTSKA